jgi:hypothetical protein
MAIADKKVSVKLLCGSSNPIRDKHKSGKHFLKKVLKIKAQLKRL